MKNKLIALVTAATLCASLTACGTTAATTAPATSSASSAQTETTSSTKEVTLGVADNALAQDKEALISATAPKFTTATYTDEETGKTLTYNVFLPADYDETKTYPTVVFIADASTVGKGAEYSLTQGLGGVVWASDAWQEFHPTIVIVPVYDETVLDDHSGYTTSDYVEITHRFIQSLGDTYAVDTKRIYGTGQSMGAMTTMLLAGQDPDLYAGVMLVDGQWDLSQLQGLKKVPFLYFAAADDERAAAGQQEVVDMFDQDKVPYSAAEWDGTWDPDALSDAAASLFEEGNTANFITWKTGTIESKGGGQGGYHMGSFDYAYKSIAAMEWLFKQE